MQLDSFLSQLRTAPAKIHFKDTIAVIDAHYDFAPCSFRNGEIINLAGQNSGSCKLFAFAKLHALSPTETLACFGHYYRDEVQGNPAGEDHQNIRNFMRSGWSQVVFDGEPLSPRQTQSELK